MRVFVAGASGAIGRPLVPKLAEAGHEVTGTTRSEESAEAGTYYGQDGSMTADVRRRRLPIVGKGTGVTSFIHVEDAADATVAAVERGPSGVYNITDDEPARGVASDLRQRSCLDVVRRHQVGTVWWLGRAKRE